MPILLLLLPIIAAALYVVMRGDGSGAGALELGAAVDPAQDPAPSLVESIQLAGAGILQSFQTGAGEVSRTVQGWFELSPAGVDQLAQREGLRLTPYRDQAGLWTIGYGHKLTAGEWYDSITEAKARELLAGDVSTAAAAVNLNVKTPITQAQFDSLTSFTYNAGVSAFKNSTLLRKLNAGDVGGAADEFARWVYVTVGGKKQTSSGLMARREAEAQPFKTEV